MKYFFGWKLTGKFDLNSSHQQNTVLKFLKI